MYIMITTRCNMHCSHCCFSCSAKGEDMPYNMFKKIVDDWWPVLKKNNYWIPIGGGEPTLHPDFWKMISYSLTKNYVWVTTNGLKKEDALILGDMAKRGILTANLSLDEWHDKISDEVINKFCKGLKVEKHQSYDKLKNFQDPKDMREVIRIKEPFRVGRARTGYTNYCCCSNIIFKPDGKIYSCGCEDAPVIGTVEQGLFERYKEIDIYNNCHKFPTKNLTIFRQNSTNNFQVGKECDIYV